MDYLKSKLKLVLLIAIGTTMIFSCKKKNDTPKTSNLKLNISGLKELGKNFVYEGWIIVNGKPVSTGRFSKVTSPQSFSVNSSDLAAATKFVLTIEPEPDKDAGPSKQKLLAGEFKGLTANISVALGDFSKAAGTAFLRTPTDEKGMNNKNDQFGIWFGIPAKPPKAGLVLPTLPDGWVYEGWVVGDKGPISTGTFTKFNTQDSGNPFSGTQSNAGPPIPGEDFLLNAPAGEKFPLDLRGRTAVISIEPKPDNSKKPFLLKPLVLKIPKTAKTAPDKLNFKQNLSSFPKGTVTR